MSESDTPGTSTSQEAKGTQGSGPTPALSGPPRKKQRPSKSLPTDRVSFQKQVDALNAYASVHESTKNPVSNEEVGRIVKLNATTTGLMNTFFVDTGLLQKMESGFLPSDEVKAYALARQWEEEFPGHKLRTLMAETWFAQSLLPHLKVGAKDEREALTILATAATAEPAYKVNLQTLLEYLEFSGLIEREGSSVRAARPSKDVQAPPPPPKREPAPQPEGPPATSRTVSLVSGGTLTISATLDPFALSPGDRGFVFKLIDELLEYEAKSKGNAESGKEVRSDTAS